MRNTYWLAILPFTEPIRYIVRKKWVFLSKTEVLNISLEPLQLVTQMNDWMYILCVTNQEGTSRVKYLMELTLWLLSKHFCATDIEERYQTLHRLDYCHGAQFGGIQVFAVIKIIFVREVRVLPACTAVWAWRQNTHKILRGAQRSWTQLFCICFCACGRQKPEDPQIQPYCWRRNYTCGSV